MQLICRCRYFHLPPLWLSPSHWSTAFECCNWLPTLWFLAAASICCLQLPALMHTSPMQNVPSQNHTTHCLCTKLFSIDWLVAHEKCDWFATLLCHCFDLLPLNDATAHLNCCHLDLPLLGFTFEWCHCCDWFLHHFDCCCFDLKFEWCLPFEQCDNLPLRAFDWSHCLWFAAFILTHHLWTTMQLICCCCDLLSLWFAATLIWSLPLNNMIDLHHLDEPP